MKAKNELTVNIVNMCREIDWVTLAQLADEMGLSDMSNNLRDLDIAVRDFENAGSVAI